MLKRISFFYSWLILRLKVHGVTPQYREYLEMQLRRTLAKKDLVEGIKLRTKILVDQLSDFTDLSKSDVLCIGCRDHFELDYFLSKRTRRIVGIDLQSSSPDIVIMDMHNMLFSDDSFDIVYSSHSLEHSYEPKKVVNEILRVARSAAFIAIEVPVQYGARGADLIDFENVDTILNLFGDHVDRVFWTEGLPAGHPRNNEGTMIARTIFQIRKASKEDVGKS